ncbi:MAG: glycosyltransferase [Bryobacteraceae bacterium]|nr:glycosyltransferase [Bryobacteraceae bacterium]
MGKTPLVSFVVMCYRTERYVAECIDSILGQNRDFDWEAIAVDDCSPDRTAEILRGYNDPRLRVIVHAKNAGHLQTVTTCLTEARGKYIARIDSDDRYRPGFLEAMVPILERHPEVGMAYAEAAIIDPHGAFGPNTDSGHGGREFKGNELVRLLGLNFVCAPTMIARREAWLAHLPIPKNDLAFSDWYFTVNMARHWEFFYLPQVVADYRVHPGNLHSRTVLDGSEERSVRWMLEQVFSTPEQDPELERAKQAARADIMAGQLLIYARKYFGARKTEDARRLFLEAARYKPTSLMSPEPMRHFLATFLPPERYARLKAVLKR